MTKSSIGQCGCCVACVYTAVLKLTCNTGGNAEGSIIFTTYDGNGNAVTSTCSSNNGAGVASCSVIITPTKLYEDITGDDPSPSSIVDTVHVKAKASITQDGKTCYFENCSNSDGYFEEDFSVPEELNTCWGTTIGEMSLPCIGTKPCSELNKDLDEDDESGE